VYDKWSDCSIEVQANLLVFDEIREYEEMKLHENILKAVGANIIGL
jgi:hypothetical protein